MNDANIISFLRKGKQEEKTVVDNKTPPVVPQQGIIIRKIFTVTTIKVYPGGTVFHEHTSGWMDKEGYVHMKKVKKEPKKIVATVMKKVESY